MSYCTRLSSSCQTLPQYLPLSEFTAANVLALLLTVDGSGSGLDADLLDGLSSADFALDSHVHAGEDITSGTIADARISSTITRDSEVMTIVLANDGPGSGLDADLLDGLSSAAFELVGAVAAHAALTSGVHGISAFGATVTGAASQAAGRTALGLGTAAVLDVGVGASNIVQLDGTAKLPAVDGSQLTNLPGGGGTPGGSVGQVQYHGAGGVFAGDAGFSYDAATKSLLLSSALVANVFTDYSFAVDAGSTRIAYFAAQTNLSLFQMLETGNKFFRFELRNTRADVSSDTSLQFSTQAPATTIQFRPYFGIIMDMSETLIRILMNTATDSFRVIGAAGQSANLQEWRNSTNAAQFAVGPEGQLKTNQSVANTNTPSGATARAMPLYSEAGVLLGYVPIYAAQW